MFKRINLRLNKEVALRLDNYALHCGYTKAGIIRQWIENTNEIDWYAHSPSSGNKVNYSLRLESDTYAILERIAYTHGLSINSLACRLVHYKLENKSWYSLKELWQQGRVNELSTLLGDRLDIMSSEQLLLYAETHLHLADFPKVNAALEYVAMKIHNLRGHESLEQGYIYKLQSEMATYENRIDQSHSLNSSALAIAETHNDRRLLGTVYSEKAKYFLSTEDFEQAEKYFLIALDYLDIVNYPVDVIRIYTRLIYVQEFLSDGHRASFYLDRLYSILQRIQNHRFYGCYYTYLGSHQQLYNTAILQEIKKKLSDCRTPHLSQRHSLGSRKLL